MKIRDIINSIEEKFPLETQMEFDNSGLKCGNPEDELNGVLVTLDTTIDVVKEAIDKECNLIIEHHPTIFNPLFSLNYEDPKVEIITKCLKNNICLYSAHTNIDVGNGGLNDYFLNLLKCKKIKINESTSNKNMLRVGELDQTCFLKEYVDILKNVFNEKIQYVGNPNTRIKRVGCINGSAGKEEYILESKKYADVYVSSEFKHSALMLAKNLHYAIIQVSHYSSEIGFLDLIYTMLKSQLSQIKIYKSKLNHNPIRG